MNPAWSFNVGLTAQWRATGSLMVYVGYSFIKTWRYAATNTLDEFTPKAVDANGNPVADVGLGQSDRTSTVVGASYQLNEHYSLDLGVATSQAPLHDDDAHVRFPFLSIGSWAANRTNLYFTLTAAY
jgi:long-subunit fatty acid transport protein